MLRQVIGAQDSTTIEHLKQIYQIYTTDDIVKKTGVVTKREIPINKSLHEVIEKAEAENKEKQKAEVTEPKKPAIKFIKRAEPKPQITEPQPKVEESTPAATSSIIISTFADEKYDYVAADANKAIAEIMAAVEKTMVNKMLQVKDHTTGQPVIISVKAIMKMECK